ncbi:hypothetical protein [Pseudomonas cremoricolorata]|uniref:Thiamine pyrophosphate-binding protein n=1 Tax=Pseudomonas cremoricolorata TaxID=157783 RepID=A0A089WVF9_9PSED|nr:hypothetical protein [Pseudomonas cremoricolorata]AIR91194.1 thiamine pyrophosphate-binding protein [Pseudomonas cremoricolorata]
MSRAQTVQHSAARQWWLKWRFHLNILLILVPLGFMPKYFADMRLFRGEDGLGQHVQADIPVGRWSVSLAEMRDEAPLADGPAGYFKTFNAALCATCDEGVKAIYLRVGKPRSLRAAGSILFGSQYRMATSLPIPPRTRPDALLWITIEGWDGNLYQASVPLADASPATAAWLAKQGDKR